ncbi:MAG TPA: M48 family metallopeptidase, partial [Bryobacteraceae bacterium]|nr:M48 family metallopeptidase [Bryobacteraceae bacterium]
MLRTFGLALLSAAFAAAFAQNPFSLSEKDEIELGRQAAALIEQDLRLVEEPAVVQYVDALGQSLVQVSGRKGIAYTFKVVDSPEINAFALPGGFIYVNRGLIEAADTQDELAGVLAHEIGHVVARHGADQAMRAGMVQTGLGALGGLLGRGTSSSISQMAAEMVATGVFMRFSRQAEREADRLGARMVYDAKLQPQGMVSFFDKLGGLQKTQPNAVQQFFLSHPSPAERSNNVASLIASYPATAGSGAQTGAFQDVKKLLAALPRPEVEAAKEAAAIAAAARPPAQPEADVRQRNMIRDRDIAARFAPVFHQALGPAPRFDYITNFDFDGDWKGDNNWNNADGRRYPLKAFVYYAVFETRTHFFVHYAAFHPRDYKGGEKRGALLSEAMRAGVGLGGQYDPTGRSNEAVMAHENDLEGALIVAEKSGEDYNQARLVLVETLAHNNYLKYVPPGSPLSGDPIMVEGVRPRVFVEPKGHGIESWRDDAAQHKAAEGGFLVYIFGAAAEDP